MRKIKIFFRLFVLFLAQSACYAPQINYPSEMPTAIYAQVPALANCEENNFFTIDAAPGAVCHAGIGYYNYDDKWTTMELPTIESLDTGSCKWEWKVPEDAKDGVAELRGYIQQGDFERNVFPATFCIEVCK